jgi:hypothetical protein
MKSRTLLINAWGLGDNKKAGAVVLFKYLEN